MRPLWEARFRADHGQSGSYAFGSVPRNTDGASDPPVAVNPRQVDMLRAAGASWRVVSERLGIGVGTACRALLGCSKNLPESALASA
jgi:hypothetical protein